MDAEEYAEGNFGLGDVRPFAARCRFDCVDGKWKWSYTVVGREGSGVYSVDDGQG